jgi:hypothetical protein
MNLVSCLVDVDNGGSVVRVEEGNAVSGFALGNSGVGWGQPSNDIV